MPQVELVLTESLARRSTTFRGDWRPEATPPSAFWVPATESNGKVLRDSDGLEPVDDKSVSSLARRNREGVSEPLEVDWGSAEDPLPTTPPCWRAKHRSDEGADETRRWAASAGNRDEVGVPAATNWSWSLISTANVRWATLVADDERLLFKSSKSVPVATLSDPELVVGGEEFWFASSCGASKPFFDDATS